MQVINCKDFKLEEPCAVAIGKFDGLHKGHKIIVDELIRSKQEGLATVILSFDPSPEVYFGRQEGKYVLTEEEKQELLSARGVDYYILYPFDKETAETKAEDFLKNVLVDKLNMKKLVAGVDLAFGYEGKGNADLLKKMEAEYGYKTTIYSKFCIEDEEVSASALRDSVMLGEMERCDFWMGRKYMISGTVCEGNHLGNTLGFPTCNVIPAADKLLPPKGVYVTLCQLDGELYPAITNIGTRPTVSDHEGLCVETHLLGLDKNCYDLPIKIYFCTGLRGEQKFDSLEALQKQMRKDAIVAEKFFLLFGKTL